MEENALKVNAFVNQISKVNSVKKKNAIVIAIKIKDGEFVINQKSL